jgi:hypothetical protein
MGWDWNEKNKRFTGAAVLFAAIWSEESGEGKIIREEKRVFQ